MLIARSPAVHLRGAVDLRDTMNQMAFIGVASLPIVLITVAFSGAVLALYMSQIVVKMGNRQLHRRGGRHFDRPRDRAGADVGRGRGPVGQRDSGRSRVDEGDRADRRPARACGQPGAVSGRAQAARGDRDAARA